MAHQRDHLVIRHARGTDDTDDAGERSRLVLRCDNGPVLEAWILVLVPDGDRDALMLAAPAKKVAKHVAGFREIYEASESFAGRELRLLGQHRRLPEHNLLLTEGDCALEELLALLHEDVEQL